MMRYLAIKLRETFIHAGCRVEWFRINESKRRIEGKVTYGNDNLYVHVSPDIINAWDGILSDDKERGAFAWGMREAWIHPQTIKPPTTLTDIPEGSVENAYRVIVEKPLHYQGGFYFIKICMVVISLLAANGILGIV